MTGGADEAHQPQLSRAILHLQQAERNDAERNDAERNSASARRRADGDSCDGIQRNDAHQAPSVRGIRGRGRA